MMRTFLYPILPALALVGAPVFAQDADPTTSNKPDTTAQPEGSPAVTINGTATVVSDYRFRGISQTDKRFAVQGSLTVSHASGFYVSVWGSSIDDYVAKGADQEIDLIAGYKKTFGGTTLDAGLLYYYYPGSGGVNSDFVEPYVSLSHTIGPVTGKVTANYAPKQRATYSGLPGRSRDDNLYLAGDLSATVNGVGVSAHLGHSFGPSYLTIGRGYTDWGAGVNYTIKALTLGVSYVDTNKSFITPKGRNASKAGIVGSVGVSF